MRRNNLQITSKEVSNCLVTFLSKTCTANKFKLLFQENEFIDYYNHTETMQIMLTINKRCYAVFEIVYNYYTCTFLLGDFYATSESKNYRKAKIKLNELLKDLNKMFIVYIKGGKNND